MRLMIYILGAMWIFSGELNAAESLAVDSAGNMPLLERSWKYLPGAEYPGAVGSFVITTEEGVPAGLLKYDFSAGGSYVGASVPVEIAQGWKELRFRARSEESCLVSIRVIDANKKMTSIQVPYTQAGEWQTLRFIFSSGTKKNEEGIRFPIRTLMVVVHKKNGDPDGSLAFSEFQLLR